MLIQGWAESGRWKNSLLKEVLENIPGVYVVVVDYLDDVPHGKNAYFNSHRKIEEYAGKVETLYLLTKGVNKNIPILVIGHSLGGIITRLLCKWGRLSAKDAIFIGTPNHGITYKSIGGSIFGLLVCPLLWIISSKWVCNVPAYRQLFNGSNFLENLNAGNVPQDAYYIVGENDSMVPKWSGDPHGTAVRVDCDHHLVPFNGKKLKDLTLEEKKIFDNSAIPVIEAIVRQRLV